jgi:hypothetical protein
MHIRRKGTKDKPISDTQQRLQAESTPNSAYCGLRQLRLLRHCQGAPMGCVHRLRFQRFSYNSVGTRIVKRAGSARARRIK